MPLSFVFSMLPTKAPGEDGLPALFYQNLWPFISDEVNMACLSILNEEHSIAYFNSTIISLVPKCNTPKRVTELSPIILCNVMYKIVAKCITNRFKSIMPSVVFESQSAFVPERLISDNTIIAFETLNIIKRAIKRKKGTAA